MRVDRVRPAPPPLLLALLLTALALEVVAAQDILGGGGGGGSNQVRDGAGEQHAHHKFECGCMEYWSCVTR